MAVGPSLMLGTLFAVASAISGYFLSKEGGYDDRLLETHETLGIATAIFSAVVYILYAKAHIFFQEKNKRKAFYIVLFVPLIVLVSLTGHFGGSMTHGEDYLFEIVRADLVASDPSLMLKAVTNVKEAVLYSDIIEPILQARCYSCHSASKQKGELRLDGISYMQRGGEHGDIFEPGNADSSSLFTRLMLPLEDEDHMPPNEKPQPASSEIALIQTWINEGASFTMKVSQCREETKITTYFHAVVEQAEKEQLIPEQEIEPADEKILADLNDSGVRVLPVSRESNYLSVSFLNKRVISANDIRMMLLLKKQIVWLDLARTTASDSTLEAIGQLGALRQLSVEYTKITDRGLKSLASLSNLRYVNLVGTKITDAGLQQLTTLKNLESIFVYQTPVTKTGVKKYQETVPKTFIDTGRYQLPKLVSDSVARKDG